MRSVYRAGSAVIVVAVFGTACSDTFTPADERFAIAGRVHAPRSADFTTLHAVWRSGTAADSVRVAADGRFRIPIPADRVRGELSIDGDEPRAFHPFLFPFHADTPMELDIVLVPRVWSIRRGIYAGQAVDVSADVALDDDVARIAYTYYFGRPVPWPDGNTFQVNLRMWPEDRLPVDFAFDHVHSVPPIGATDSAAIWALLNRIEVVFGRDLFRPAVADPAWWPELDDHGFVPGVIRFGFHPDEGAVGIAATDGDVPRIWEHRFDGSLAGGRFDGFALQHRSLNSGRVWLRDLEGWSTPFGLIPWDILLAHEVVHLLGVGHTTRMPSTQTGLRDVTSPDPTAHDVAYIELLWEVMRLERELDTLLGIIPALIGERVLLLGLPALPHLGSR